MNQTTLMPAAAEAIATSTRANTIWRLPITTPLSELDPGHIRPPILAEEKRIAMKLEFDKAISDYDVTALGIAPDNSLRLPVSVDALCGEQGICLGNC